MLYNFNHVREDSQREQMDKLEAAGVCMFCREHLEGFKKEPIEFEGDWWVVTKNDFPYQGSSFHYLLVYKPEHITSCTELTPEAWTELGEHVKHVCEKHNIPGGSVFMRFGDTDYNGSSINHLHAHIISGAPYSEDAEGMRVKLGYKK